MLKVVVVGDSLVSSDTLEDAARQLNIEEPLEVKKFEWNSNLEKDAFQEVILKIEKHGPESMEIPEGILEEIETADYLFVHIAPVSKEMLDKAKNLKLIGTCRGGLEHLNMEECTNKKIPVIHVIRNAEPVADFALGLMLTETRNIARAHHYIKEGKWVKSFANDPYKTTLRNLKVGLLGLGYIGKLVVKRLKALGVEVIAYDPYVDREKLKQEGIDIEFVQLEELFSISDIISLHARVTPETTNIVNKKLFELMKPSSYLINTARAGLVDKKDLIDVLKNKKIGGAALDVVWEEPIAAGDELLELENITLTPHIAGDTIDAIPRSPYLLRDVINDYLKNNTSDMLVNLK
ncbi:2-hydroxyacid dehydrogenase [Oceanobacillus jeddahense]|uniref:2-hydroxyacid dehydrogenase n=1 Tax=Oceanobacillus jeddahense TaxID=1462527 RepID=A0ABY5JSM1_9BACI|nr:2-hydroxyacid dehydrogenase [Oceanobacillus jeddahense]UUI03318.1 2-hydroxyacid dehydrogenase [Oceanobacillus jeddahense]